MGEPEQQISIDQILGEFYTKQQASNRTIETLIASLFQVSQILKKKNDELTKELGDIRRDHPELFKEKKVEDDSPKNT